MDNMDERFIPPPALEVYARLNDAGAHVQPVGLGETDLDTTAWLALTAPNGDVYLFLFAPGTSWTTMTAAVMEWLQQYGEETIR